MEPGSAQVVKEMGITHRDFFRVLPRVFGAQPYEVTGLRIVAGAAGHRVEIALSAEGERRLGPVVALPVTRVTLTFEGYSPAERTGFLAHFDHQYFRGGG